MGRDAGGIGGAPRRELVAEVGLRDSGVEGGGAGGLEE